MVIWELDFMVIWELDFMVSWELDVTRYLWCAGSDVVVTTTAQFQLTTCADSNLTHGA